MDAPTSDTRKCPFCSSWFSRVDATKRHARRCSQRKGRDLLDRKRGRRVRSCDQCSRVKVHCEPQSTGPCKRCIPRNLACSFGQSSPQLATSPPSPVLPEVIAVNDGRIPLSFLLNATDDQQDFLTERAVGLEPDGAPLGPACLPLPSSTSDGGLLDFLDPSILLLFDHGPRIAPGPPDTLSSIGDGNYLGEFDFTGSWDTTMPARLSMLETELVRHAGHSSDRLAPFDLHAYRSFFSAENVHSFITQFCRKRHYRYPIIHWPTFEPEKVSLALLMAVCLTGAAYSFRAGHDSSHAIQARTFYRLADSYVFQQLDIHLYDSHTDPKSADTIELCQAALLMYALDTLPAGDRAMQHTAVARRLPTLITTVRELGLVEFQHEPFEDREAFIYREQVVRLVAWTFCADCLATLSCNKPPGFSILEMRGDLPCDAKVWDADVVSFSRLREGSIRSTQLSLTDLMSRWLTDDWQTPIERLDLPVFHLHVMLCGKSSNVRFRYNHYLACRSTDPCQTQPSNIPSSTPTSP